ncbi:MAG: type II toxin-antitoxin system HicB family antitoxin [Lachnospira sp.]|nr:type II toxin-antitoxin system HicB family antitoxin [Lachnospira sp.]
MYKYERIIYWSDEDQKFIAEIPELAGCMADGATIEEALNQSEKVIEEWIETAKLIGREVPEAKGKLIYA